MGKKRKSDSDEEAKKKKEKKKKGKDEKKKDKKDKKNKKYKKKQKKDEASSSSSSSADADANEEVKVDSPQAATISALKEPETPAVNLDELPAPEEGIRRFTYSLEEVGPLGLRFSGGFPPLILSVAPESFSGKKGVPAIHEVHAINGLPLVPQNRETVMNYLKARPVVLDIRPQGWKPKEKVKELEMRKAKEEAERLAIVQVEAQRREQVSREAAEQAERDAAEKAMRQDGERKELEELRRRAKEQATSMRAKSDEFHAALAKEPEDLRKAAEAFMEGEYGAKVPLAGRRGVPLRLLTRRREVAWLWAGEVQELIGGGTHDPGDTWTN